MRIGLWAAFLGVVVIGGVTGYGAWRLRRGPVDLAWARSYVESAVHTAQPQARVTIGAMQLWWDGERTRPELRAIDVHLSWNDTGQDLVLPAVGIHPRLRSLLLGQAKLHHIAVLAPRLTLVRTESGIILGGEAAPAEGPPAPPLTTTAVLRHLHELLATVGFIELREGAITIDDRALTHTWGLQHVRAKLSLVDTHVIATTEAQLHSGELAANLSLHATEGAAGAIELVAGIANVIPASIMRAIPSASRFKLPPALEEVLGAVTSPLAAETRFVLAAPGQLESVIAVTALGDTFTIDDPSRGLRLRNGKLVFAADLDPATETATINDLTISSGEVALKLRGTLKQLEKSARVDLRATVARFPVAALKQYWPTAVAPDAREWVTENITNGVVKDVTANLQMSFGSSRHADQFSAKAAFDGLSVRFAPDMPPATGVHGVVSVTDNEHLFTIAGGHLEDLEITGGTVGIVVPEGPPPARVDIDVKARGPLTTAVSVLDHEPVGLARSLRRSPHEIQGNIDASVRLRVPLDKGPLEFAGDGQLENVTLPPINGWRINEGRFDVHLANNVVHADGHTNVARVPTTVNVLYDLNDSSAASVQLKADLDATARTALGVDLGDLIDGSIPMNVTIFPKKEGPWTMDVDADLTAARWSPPGAAWGKPAGNPGKMSAHLLMSEGSALHIQQFTIDAGGTIAHGSAERGTEGWRSIKATVRVPPPSKSGDPGTVDVSAEQKGSDYGISVRAANAEPLLEQFLEGDAHGGRLAFDGTIRPHPDGTSTKGHMRIDDVRFTNAPTIARVLSLGSLSGLKNSLLRDGMHFDTIEADLAFARGLIRIENGRAEGDAMSLVASGSVDTNAGQMDLRGSVIPSYYGLNRAPQKIPLIGKLVEKATGEAVQVIDARVHGPVAHPQVDVATASVVAPEIIKKRLRGWNPSP